MSGAVTSTAWELVEDGRLRLRAHPAVAELVRGWIPLFSSPVGDDGGAALVELCLGAAPGPRPTDEPPLRFGSAAGWMDAAGGVELFSDSGFVAGRVDAARRHAQLCVAGAAASPAQRTEVHEQATVAAALLLGGLGRALLHGAAVASPRGGTWLLVGDTHAGKSTTCVTLLDGGWGYLSDDHVVLSTEDGGVRVEGWARRFNLDAPGRSSGGRARVAVDPRERWPGRARRSAPLAGLLFPRVEAASPTALVPVRPAEALGRVIRAAPWLLFDPASAPRVLALLRAAAGVPAFSLRLGTDSYRNPEALLRCIGAVAGAG